MEYLSLPVDVSCPTKDTLPPDHIFILVIGHQSSIKPDGNKVILELDNPTTIITKVTVFCEVDSGGEHGQLLLEDTADFGEETLLLLNLIGLYIGCYRERS